MIHRGTNHVIFSEFEITERIRRPETIKLLGRLTWYYEEWSRLNLLESYGNVQIAWDQTQEFKELMEDTRKWLQPDESSEKIKARSPSSDRSELFGSATLPIRKPKSKEVSQRVQLKRR